jgi:hypothetical protein
MQLESLVTTATGAAAAARAASTASPRPTAVRSARPRTGRYTRCSVRVSRRRRQEGSRGGGSVRDKWIVNTPGDLSIVLRRGAARAQNSQLGFLFAKVGHRERPPGQEERYRDLQHGGHSSHHRAQDQPDGGEALFQCLMRSLQIRNSPQK